jgi:hypothetical protein
LAIASNYRKALGPVGEMLSQRLERNPVVGWGMTLLYVGLGWILFFYPLPEAIRMTGLLFKLG